jgi:hypothetical protein
VTDGCSPTSPQPHEEAGEETHAGAGAPPHATKDETPAVAQQVRSPLPTPTRVLNQPGASTDA